MPRFQRIETHETVRIFSTITDLKQALDEPRKSGLSIGFVPTMGALHAGHLSLIDTSKAQCDVTVCSIFVNPTQFNNAWDLSNYPKTLDHDETLLREKGCDMLFIPNESEIYPETPTDRYEFGKLEQVMEGAQRPGHFNGVAQVVVRLLEAVNPDLAFLGLKDYQQYLIIKALAAQLNLPVHIIGCETVREPDGLAMSSRNALLTPEYRRKATVLWESLRWVAHHYNEYPDSELIQLAEQKIKDAGLKPEYLTIAHVDTLQPLKQQQADAARVFVAARAGDVRLIDNMPIIT